jgi:hypothetical protein
MSDTMPLADLLRDYTPGDGHSWDDEMQWLKENHNGRLALLTLNILAHGIREPILLGNDGRVWDGHHRIYVAHQLKIQEVPVEYAGDNNE